MAGAWTTLSVKDGGGTSRAMRVWDESGAGTGPFLYGMMAGDGAGSGGELALNSSITTVFGTAALDQGSGTGGSHTLRTLIDSSQVGPAATASTGSAVPSGAVYNGFDAATALATAATAGNIVGAMSDKFGRQVMLPVTIRDLVGTQTTTISASTSETTIITAGAAGVFNDLIALIVSNTSASTNTRIDFRDATAGSIMFSLESIAGAPPVGIPFMGVPIPQTAAANNWTAQCASSTTDIRVYAIFAKNK